MLSTAPAGITRADHIGWLAAGVTDEDIDAILSRGEAKTAELKAKFEAVGEDQLDSLQNFTFDTQATS